MRPGLFVLSAGGGVSCREGEHFHCATAEKSRVSGLYSRRKAILLVILQQRRNPSSHRDLCEIIADKNEV